MLHQGEIVLNRQQAEHFMRNRFQEGSMPNYDPMTVDSRQFQSEGGSTSSVMDHRGEIVISPNEDFMTTLKKVMTLLQQKAQGDGGGERMRMGDPIDPPYA